MKCGRIYTDPVCPLNFSHKYEKFLSTTTKPNQIFQPGVDAQSDAVDEAKNPKFARGGAEMPKSSSDVTLKCCWRESYNPERVFSTLPVTEMGLFTGLGCSCFRQIYCSSPLEDLSNFPVEKSKERKANLQGKSRLEGCAKPAAPRGVFLVGFGGTGRIPEPGLPCGAVG